MAAPVFISWLTTTAAEDRQHMIDGDHSRWGNWNWWQPFWRAAVNRKSRIISVVTRQQFVPCPGSPGCHGDQERDIVKTAMTNVACSGRRGAVSHWGWAQHQHNNRHEAPHLIIISVIRTESTGNPSNQGKSWDDIWSRYCRYEEYYTYSR